MMTERLRALAIDGPMGSAPPPVEPSPVTIPLPLLTQYLQEHAPAAISEDSGTLWFELTGRRYDRIMYQGFKPIIQPRGVQPTLQGRPVWEFTFNRLVGPRDSLDLLVGGSADMPPVVRMFVDGGAVTLDIDRATVKACSCIVFIGEDDGIAIAMLENIDFMAVGSN